MDRQISKGVITQEEKLAALT
ncbi:MAG: hypothetical protein RLZ16_76, partial [Bacteroidota bacterium]